MNPRPPRVPYHCPARDGFTLIELSIGLIIIGLVVGGVLPWPPSISVLSMWASVIHGSHFSVSLMTSKLPNGGAITVGRGGRGRPKKVVQLTF